MSKHVFEELVDISEVLQPSPIAKLSDSTIMVIVHNSQLLGSLPLCCKALIALPGPSDSTFLSFVFQSTPSIAGCIMKLFEFCLHYSHDQTYKPKSVDMVHQAFCCCCCEELGLELRLR